MKEKFVVLRKAIIGDLYKIMYVVDEVKEEMKKEGNDQFNESYPSEDHFREDIENGYLYVKGIGIDIAGVICISNKEFSVSKDLNWSRKTPSIVFYRLIVNKLYRRRGIGQELVCLAENISKMQGLNYVKGATYEINDSMLSLFDKLNYSFVGKAHVEGRKYPFHYYEKLL